MRNTFSATIDHLKWCRVVDVLRWIHTNDDGDMLEFFVDNIGNPERYPTIAIPCNEFTASVIARSAISVPTLAHQLNWDRVKYILDTNHLRFMCNAHDGFGFITLQINPDPTGKKTSWTRAEIDAILETMR